MTEYRETLLARIAACEAQGGESYFQNVEDDPPSRPLLPGEVDYLSSKFTAKCKTALASCMEGVAKGVLSRRHQIRVVGGEEFAAIRGGVIMTGNHFAVDESLCAKIAAERAGRKRLYKVVREGNYFMPGVIGFLLKHARTLPLSSNLHTMGELDRAISTLLKRGETVLIYPEQAMWWNYRKPRPYRIGAFRYAAKNNVPVVPYFVEMQDIPGKTDKDGYPLQSYTVHMLPALYSDPGKTVRENANAMLAENARLVREKYEAVYGIPLLPERPFM